MHSSPLNHSNKLPQGGVCVIHFSSLSRLLPLVLLPSSRTYPRMICLEVVRPWGDVNTPTEADLLLAMTDAIDVPLDRLVAAAETLAALKAGRQAGQEA